MMDPVEQAYRDWDAAQAKALAQLPVCDWCGEPIQDETCYEVFGKIYCKSCMDDCIVFTDDLMEGNE